MATPPEKPEPPDTAEAGEPLSGALGPEMGTAGDSASGRLDCVLAGEADRGSAAIGKLVLKASFEPEYESFDAGARAVLFWLGENRDTVAAF